MGEKAKKPLLFILAIALILSLFTTFPDAAVAGDTDPAFTAVASYSAESHAIEVAVSIENNPGIWKGMLRIRLLASNTVLAYSEEPIVASEGNPYIVQSYDYSTSSGLTINFQTESISLSSYNGKLFTVLFPIKDGAASDEYTIATDRNRLFADTSAESTYTQIENPLTISYTIPVPDGFVYVEEVGLNETTKTIKTTEEPFQLSAMVSPENATITHIDWTSSDTTVAWVSSDGLVTPRDKAGTATIRATATDGSYVYNECIVTVEKGVTGITIASNRAKILTVGDTDTVAVNILPGDATNAKVIWSIDIDGVITVDDSGKVTAVALGDATVTATTEDGGYTASVKYRVTAAAPEDKAAKIGNAEYDTLTEAIAALESGETVTLLKDVAETDITLDKDCSLNLNGYALQAAMLTVPYGVTVDSIYNGMLILTGSTNIPNISNFNISGTVNSIFDCDITGTIFVTQVTGDSPVKGFVELIQNCDIVGGVSVHGELVEISGCDVIGTISAGGNRGVNNGGSVTGAYMGLIWAIRDCNVTSKNANTGTISVTYGEMYVYGGSFADTGTANSSWTARINQGGTLFIYGGRYKSDGASRHGIYGNLVPAGYIIQAEPDADGYYEVVRDALIPGKATFQLDPADAELKLRKSSGDTDETPLADASLPTGSVSYDVEKGAEYTYTVTKAGYTTKTGQLRIEELPAITIPVTLTPVTGGEPGQTGPKTAKGGDIITSGGTYTLESGALGIITVMTREPVTIVGKGITDAAAHKFSDLTIDCSVSGAAITIKDLWINNNVGKGTPSGSSVNFGSHILNFTGTGNTLRFEGENLIETQEYVQGAGIHVPKGASLTFDGSGTLYVYKYSQGAGIGGNSYEASGTITFAGGNIFIKGSKTGPLIGGDSLQTGIKNDPVYIDGGTIVLINKANGAGIGASKQGTGAGEVYLRGGNLTTISDFLGSAIGSGGDRNGTPGNLYVSGGSFKAVRTGNSLYGSYDSANAYIDDSLVTAAKHNGSGKEAALLIFDTTKLAKPASAFTVSASSGFSYSGGFHNYRYTESTAYTPDNFGYDDSDKSLYLYLSKEAQTLTVNNERFAVAWDSAEEAFTVTNESGAVVSTPGGETADKPETEASVETTVKDGEATVSVEVPDRGAGTGDEPERLVVNVDTKGETVSRITVELPKEVMALESGSKSEIEIRSEVANILLPEKAVAALAGTGEAVTVKAAKNDDASYTFTVAAGEKNIDKLDGGIKAVIPAEETTPGTVAVIVRADGTEEVIKKSVGKDGKVSIPLDGSATVKIVDNSKTFGDVGSGAWYNDAVRFASSHELFTGTGGDRFSPDMSMTRGMLVTVLHRLENTPAAAGELFADVAGDAYYADAVVWASANSIVNGTGSGFAPDADITREQLAVMLYRYAQLTVDSGQLTVDGGADLSTFPDAGSMSGWAEDALQWAVAAGLIQGRDSGLAPQGTATRAEVATILERFIENMI
jgi:hypothetical protein